MNVIFFPVISDREQLIDIISRASWFLTFCRFQKIYLPIGSSSLKDIVWQVAPGMDPSIVNNFEKLRGMVDFVLAQSETDLDNCMQQSSIILQWEKSSLPDFVSPATLAKWQRGKKVLQVDPVAIRMEGSFYIEAGLHSIENKVALIEENKKKFRNLSENLGTFKRAYLMATGPSVAGYNKFDYEGALSIVCNSVILDEELMDTVRPQILVFADPIFHFGPSIYSASFRKKLVESIRKHKYTICIPFKYYSIFISILPELAVSTIGIPYTKRNEFNFDLNTEFILKSTANILSFLMVPLATTFADEIGVLGCNGRPLNENTYFWKHNPTTQFNDKMENIRDVHPGFFNIDYNDYYIEHCEILEEQLRAGEENGKTFLSLGFSHIPALSSRIHVGRRKNRFGECGFIQKTIVVDPDAKSWAGHYMAYNEKLTTQLKQDNLDTVVICRKDIDSKIIKNRENYIPALSAHSWEIANSNEKDGRLAQFEAEITDVLSRLNAQYSPVLIYMYCGSIEHVKAFARIQEKFPSIFFNINLFFLSLPKPQGWVVDRAKIIAWLDAMDGRFVATLPTQELQHEIAQITGCLLPIAPHPSTGLSDEQYGIQKLTTKTEPNNRKYNVLFPSSPRLEKGYLHSLDGARLLSSIDSIKVILRHAPISTTPKELTQLSELPQNIKISKGELSDEEFGELFDMADIVVLPYSSESFAKRTSGLLIDAMYYRIPSIVIKGTWLANIVHHFGCGVVIEDSSPQLLADAVTKITADYSHYRAKVEKAAVEYFTGNSWQCFGAFLLQHCSADIQKAKYSPLSNFVAPYEFDNYKPSLAEIPLQNTSAEISALKAELQHKDDYIAALTNSLSWRITSPLRAVATLLHYKGKKPDVS